MASAVSQSHEAAPLLQEAWNRVTSGKYVVLSWEALDLILRDENNTEFHLTSDLVARCSFIAKKAFEQKNLAAFREAVTVPKGIAQETVGKDKRFGLAEEIKLARFLKEEDFLADEGRIFVSADLVAPLSSGEMTPELLANCVFVEKQVFNPRIKKKFAFDVNCGEPLIKKVAKLSTAIRGLQQMKIENEKSAEDDPIELMYTILVRPPDLD